MVRINPRDLVKKIKEKAKSDEKSNVTFRVNNDLMNQFREKCEKEDISMNSIVEALISSFVYG